VKLIAAILWLSAMAFGYQQHDHIYGWEGDMHVIPEYSRCFRYEEVVTICVANKGNNTPLHLVYFPNGSRIIVDEEGNIWPFLSSVTDNRSGIEEFNYGVH
jgi:hypothetical protein